MANEKFTQLPTVPNASASDIICAVQGGTSVQETLAQVLALGLSSTILNYAGNPNTNVAGTSYQLLWDTSHNFMWVCTASGNASTATWETVIGTPTNGQLPIGFTGTAPSLATISAGTGITVSNSTGTITISSTGGGVSWTEITGTTQQMTSNNGYVANNAGLVTLTLPATSAVGDALYIAGKGTGGWAIAQTSGQQINIGSSASTSGATGSIASTNQFDSLQLVCLTANTIWACLGGPQSAGLTIV